MNRELKFQKKKNSKLWFSVFFVIIKMHCIPSALQLGRKKGNINDLPDQKE